MDNKNEESKLELIKAIRDVAITALTVAGAALTAYFNFRSNKSKD